MSIWPKNDLGNYAKRLTKSGFQYFAVRPFIIHVINLLENSTHHAYISDCKSLFVCINSTNSSITSF